MYRNVLLRVRSSAFRSVPFCSVHDDNIKILHCDAYMRCTKRDIGEYTTPFTLNVLTLRLKIQ